MSQQINLLLPALRPRFDWLALPVVTGAALAGLFLLLVLAQVQAFRVDRLSGEEAAINGQLLNLQQQVQSLGKSLSDRHGNADLPLDIAAAKIGVAQRQEVLSFVGQGTIGKGSGFSDMLQGFSRQAVDGAWLVGFGLALDGIEIRGRLLDPALLPVYIDRLNDDAAFAGRRFTALEMKAVDPAAERRDEAKKAEPRPVVGGRYTEFVLRTESAPLAEKAR